MEVPSVIGEGR